jgi:acyl dehydratase
MTLVSAYAPQMSVDKGHIGKPTGNSVVVFERAPLSNFATAVKDPNPVYHDVRAAQAAGFDNIPAPPTFTFAAENWGKHAELQADEKQPPNPMGEILAGLRGAGGIILHGEQEFIYHRPIIAGDVLTTSGSVKEIYEKQSGDKTMTFIVTETVFSDASSGEPVLTQRFNLIHRA